MDKKNNQNVININNYNEDIDKININKSKINKIIEDINKHKNKPWFNYLIVDNLYHKKIVNSKYKIYLWKKYLEKISKNIDLKELKKRNKPRIELYIHTPFCLNKCKYCVHDSIKVNKFNLLNKDFLNRYIKLLIKEFKIHNKLFNSFLDNFPFKGVYFGGGTPSIYNKEQIKLIIQEFFNNFNVSNDYEKTYEIALNSIDYDKLKIILKYFNRISFGIQSFDKNVLKEANRFYPEINKINLIKEFKESYDFILATDLIWGLKRDNIKNFENSLRKTLELNLDEITIYHLLKPKEFNNYNQDYFKSYKEPYTKDDVVKILNKLKDNFNDYEFILNSLNKVIIKKKHIKKNKLKFLFSDERKYLADFIYRYHNSILGIGLFSYSYIGDYFKYLNYINKIKLSYFKSIKQRKLNYIIYNIEFLNLDLYKKRFNSNLLDDFKIIKELINKEILIKTNNKIKVNRKFLNKTKIKRFKDIKYEDLILYLRYLISTLDK